MATEQQRAYDDAERIQSDPFGLWDRDNRNHAKKARLIRQRTAAEPGDVVLEVGCGDGLHARGFAGTWDLTAVDLSARLCRRCRARAPGATVVQADARDLPFATDRFDAVVGSAVLHHLPDAEAALREWLRVAEQSVTLVEPNYLFPKDFLTAHLVAEEQHKSQMAPWRLRETLATLPAEADLTQHIFTPPWPASLGSVYDRIDATLRRVPGLRATSQLLRIHLAC
jgi:ubiquinone/menaquinone biosynthesis C-methylase UbiE